MLVPKSCLRSGLWFHIFVSSCPPCPDLPSLVVNTCNRSKCSIFLKLNNRGFDFSWIFMIIFEYLWMKRFSNRVLAVYYPRNTVRIFHTVSPIFICIFRYSNPSIFSNLKPSKKVEPEEWRSQKNRKISKKKPTFGTIWRVKPTSRDIFRSLNQ